jgi:ATP-dependent DNA ligase
MPSHRRAIGRSSRRRRFLFSLRCAGINLKQLPLTVANASTRPTHCPIRRTEPFDDPEWVFDLKYDGFRGICYLEQGCSRMISRNTAADITTAPVTARPSWRLSAVEVRNAGRRILPT